MEKSGQFGGKSYKKLRGKRIPDTTEAPGGKLNADSGGGVCNKQAALSGKDKKNSKNFKAKTSAAPKIAILSRSRPNSESSNCSTHESSVLDAVKSGSVKSLSDCGTSDTAANSKTKAFINANEGSFDKKVQESTIAVEATKETGGEVQVQGKLSPAVDGATENSHAANGVDGQADEGDKMATQQEEDKALLEAYIAEASARLKEKADLRAANLAASEDRSDLPGGKLDSSLKKNTAFIKKLRNLTEAQYQSLSKEASGLNLSRYIGEAANALLECRLKMNDVQSCVLLCSALHQRYADFAPTLLAGFTKLLTEKSDDKASNISKLRVDLRLFAELVAVGLFSQKEGLRLLGSVLTSLVSNDKKEHKNVSVIVSFCRYCGEDFMGLLPSRVDAAAKALNMMDAIPRSDFLTSERRKNVRQLMRDYYATLTEHVLLQHKLIQHEERHNRRLLETRGEVEEARVAAVATEVAVLDKLMQHAAAMADYLQEQVPQLPTEAHEGEEGGLLLEEDGSGGSFAALDAANLWEDEDTKAFYTNLPELKALLPSILYAESEKIQTPSSDEGANECEKSDEDELVDPDAEVVDASEVAQKEEEDEKIATESEERVGTLSNKTAKQKIMFQEFLNTLPSCINRELIDNLALEFCLNFNTKPLRKKLARALFLVPRHRQDLLPFYARLVAALKPLMPDLPLDLIDRLKMDFRYQVKKKDQINLDSKMKVCRFLGELLKFGILPPSDYLHCLRLLLADFRYHHVDMVCALLETAGRYLFRTPSTRHRTKVLLDQMMRKKTALSFEPRYDTMITNAYYYVNPPERSQLAEVAPLPPLLQYIKHLIVERLSKSTVEKILRVMRKLDWKDRETTDYCVCRLSSPWEVKFLNIRCLANLVSGLVMYHDWVGPAVVDNVLEDIRIGLESNKPYLNQHRIASVKYLAELYNYKVIESAIIFKVLYCMISFGAGATSEELLQELDPPEQLLRLRLVVTILDTCGAFFSAGHSKRKLDCFITYFQYYYQYKRMVWYASDSFPYEYDQVVRECLTTLRPSLVLFADFDEACQAILALNQQLISKALMQAPELREFFPDQKDASGLTIIAEQGDELDDDEEEDERDRGYEDEERDLEATQSDDEGESQEESAQDNTQPETVSAAPVVTLKPMECQENDDFVSALERILSDNFSEVAREARPNLAPVSLPLPTRFAQKKSYDQLVNEAKTEMNMEDECAPENNDKKTVKFILMSRNKQPQQAPTIAIPEDSVIVSKMRNREREEAEERRNVKRMTLEMTERQEEEEAAQELLMQQRNVVLNPHRERRVKYQHPKGAPDADLIFGSSKHRGGGGGGS